MEPLAKAALIANTYGREFDGYEYSIGCSECKHAITFRYKDLHGRRTDIFEDLQQRDSKFAHLLFVAFNSAQRLGMNELVDLSFDWHARARISEEYTEADWRIGCPGAALAASQEKKAEKEAELAKKAEKKAERAKSFTDQTS
jgi:hypothetical protein